MSLFSIPLIFWQNLFYVHCTFFWTKILLPNLKITIVRRGGRGWVCWVRGVARPAIRTERCVLEGEGEGREQRREEGGWREGWRRREEGGWEGSRGSKAKREGGGRKGGREEGRRGGSREERRGGGERGEGVGRRKGRKKEGEGGGIGWWWSSGSEEA